MPTRLKALARSRLAPLSLPIAAVAIIACAMAASAFAQVSNSATAPGPAVASAATSSPSYATMTNNGDGTMEYDNSQFGFSLTYPTELVVQEQPNGYGTMDIMFTSTTTNDQFIISASPYSQVDISGGTINPQNVEGTSDQGLQLSDVDYYPGDTPSFGFQKNGVTYDITGMHGQEAWLINILKTWQFY